LIDNRPAPETVGGRFIDPKSRVAGIVIDIETHLFGPGNAAPRVVCMSWTVIGTNIAKVEVGLPAIRSALLQIMQNIDAAPMIVGHNVAFDLSCLAAEFPDLITEIFDLYVNGRVRDTMLRGKLIDLAFRGISPNVKSYSLAGMLDTYLNTDIAASKNGGWRTNYAELDGVPIERWPVDAIEYSKNDVIHTARLATELERYRIVTLPDGTKTDIFLNEPDQCRTAFIARLTSIWGLRTDPEKVAAYKKELADRVERSSVLAMAAGMITFRKFKPTKVMSKIREAVERDYTERGEYPPLTEGGTKGNKQIRTDSDTLADCVDPALSALAEYDSAAKEQSTFLPIVELGTVDAITPSYYTLLETGRLSAKAPNVYALPRKGRCRDCFVAREGHHYISADYGSIELRALAQVCIWIVGYSNLANIFLQGIDPHKVTGSILLGVDYADIVRRITSGDTAAKDARQLAKIANFGFPGGLGIRGFIEYAKSYGIKGLTLERAQDAKNAFMTMCPEIRGYFAHIAAATNATGVTTVLHPVSQRVRGGVTFTMGSNGYFQALTADGAQWAYFCISAECYTGRSPEWLEDTPSPLYGCRPVLFLHDEFMLECPHPVPSVMATAAAKRLSLLMRKCMSAYIPDVPIEADPVITKYWVKGADPTYTDDGLLACTHPK
jgi:DNA polymerase-1